VGCSGKMLSAEEIRRIVDLLISTDMPMRDIAQRMSCSTGAVATINRKRCLRYYEGRRSIWTTPSKANSTPFG
jgi:hypothetical protein